MFLSGTTQRRCSKRDTRGKSDNCDVRYLVPMEPAHPRTALAKHLSGPLTYFVVYNSQFDITLHVFRLRLHDIAAVHLRLLSNRKRASRLRLKPSAHRIKTWMRAPSRCAAVSPHSEPGARKLLRFESMKVKRVGSEAGDQRVNALFSHI